MTAALPFSRLAQTRLFSGRGGGGWPVAVLTLALLTARNRLSTTCTGVRIQGCRVNTVATVAHLFAVGLLPFGAADTVLALAMVGLNHGNALAVHGDNQNRSGRLGREGRGRRW